jgi:hypothetical protein
MLSRLTAMIALLAAVCSLGVPSLALAGDPAPPPKPAEKPKPKPPPPGSIPTPEPCDDNPEPIFQDWNCVDPLQPWDPTEPGKPDSDPTDDKTLPRPSCPEHILDCGSPTQPRPQEPPLTQLPPRP